MSLRLVTGKSWFAFAAAAIAAAWLSACANSPSAQLPNFATGESAFATATPTSRVNPSGSVGMALLGDVQAKGLTVQEFRDAVTQRLVREGILKNPKVAVDVLNYRPIYVHGEVKNGGEFQYKSGLRLRDAVAMAGGYTYRAEQSYVLLGRDDQREMQVTMPGDAPVLPGDNIRIPERFF